uniref:Uncharacterized protein n=1 Tax=Globodera rostochiensis TaxID=31243 RepID=A0A914HKY8_GLORO
MCYDADPKSVTPLTILNYIHIHTVRNCNSGLSIGKTKEAEDLNARASLIWCGTKLTKRTNKRQLFLLLDSRGFYTKNGRRLDTTNLFVPDSVDDLFPCVMLTPGATKLKPGLNFKFNIAEEIIKKFFKPKMDS